MYVLALMLALPFYFEHKYFNMIEAKSHCFVAIAAVMLPIGAAFYVAALIKRRIGWKRLNGMDLTVLGLAAVTVLSSLLSGSFRISFLGTNGWRLGALAWILAAMSYFLVSRCLIYDQRIWLPVMAAHAFVIVIGVLHAAGVDVFWMHRGVLEHQVYLYYSTFGNATWWSGYLCLMMPATAVFLMECRAKYMKYVYAVFWVFLCFGALLSSTDGLYLGLGVCAFFFVPYICKKTKRIIYLCQMLAAFGGSILFFALMPCFRTRIEKLDAGIARTVLNPWIGLTILVASVICALLVRTVKEKFSKTARKILAVVLEAVLAAAVIYFICRTASEFSDVWGSWRGRIWTDSLQLFREFPAKDKIFGIGPEMLRDAYAGISQWFGQTVLVSHSQPLQMLLTTGILGLLLWCGIAASTIWYSRHYVREGNVTAAFFLPLTAYVGQSLINSTMTINFAMAFLFLAFTRIALGKMSLKAL